MAGIVHPAHTTSRTYPRRNTWLASALPLVGTVFALVMVFVFPLGSPPRSQTFLADLLLSVGIVLVATLLIIGPSFLSVLGRVSRRPAVIGCLGGVAALIASYFVIDSLATLNPWVFVPLHAILGAGLVFTLWPMSVRDDR